MNVPEENITWVVYETPVFGKSLGGRSVCEQNDWDAMETARPGFHTLIQAGITSERDAEHLVRGSQNTGGRGPRLRIR